MNWKSITAWLLPVLLAACATPVPRDAEFANIDTGALPPADRHFNIPGLSNCTTNQDRSFKLNSQEPVTIILHGCFGSAARFRALSQVYAFHGQQSICFSYNDRDSLYKSADEFAEALNSLAAEMDHPEFHIIAHSQGGLIARRALAQGHHPTLNQTPVELDLVTISSPFAGIAAANHCASTTARAISLGLVVPVCWAISGGKWFDITWRSDFIQQPGELLTQVREHVKIVTDESNTCRVYDEAGRCVKSDFVFSLEEQYFPAIDQDRRVSNVEIHAGHAQIVGDHQVVPYQLIEELQRQGLMRSTPVHRQSALEALLARLYLE